jgi:hypothetical protein
MPEIRLDYRARPSALAFMARAVRPSPGLKRGGVPAIAARWRHRVEPAELQRFHALSGLPEGETLPLLYPHTIGFPLHMAILTQPAFPLPIWRVLQVRNRIVQHAPLARDATLDIAVQGRRPPHPREGRRVRHARDVRDGAATAWESVNTFYVRGRFGAPTESVPEAPKRGAQKVSPGDTAKWRMPAGGGWHYGGLSGDYNGVHMFGWYARKHGFRAPSSIRSGCSASAWRACRTTPWPAAAAGRLDQGAGVLRRAGGDAQRIKP